LGRITSDGTFEVEDVLCRKYSVNTRIEREFKCALWKQIAVAGNGWIDVGVVGDKFVRQVPVTGEGVISREIRNRIEWSNVGLDGVLVDHERLPDDRQDAVFAVSKDFNSESRLLELDIIARIRFYRETLHAFVLVGSVLRHGDRPDCRGCIEGEQAAVETICIAGNLVAD